MLNSHYENYEPSPSEEREQQRDAVSIERRVEIETNKKEIATLILEKVGITPEAGQKLEMASFIDDDFEPVYVASISSEAGQGLSWSADGKLFDALTKAGYILGSVDIFTTLGGASSLGLSLYRLDLNKDY